MKILELEHYKENSKRGKGPFASPLYGYAPDKHLLVDGHGVSVVGLNLEDIVVVVEAGVADQPVRLPVAAENIDISIDNTALYCIIFA